MHTPRNIQSPYDADDFWAKWDSETPRMALFIKVTSRDTFGSEVVGLTSNTRNMTLPGHPGVTFKATPAITPTTIESGLDEPTNLEMTGIYNSDSFDQAEVLAGKWDFAEIEVFSACWDNTDLGEFVHFVGNLGEFKDYQTYFTAEGRGKMALLSNDVNKVTARLCRVKEFRDAECGHTASTVEIDGVEYNIEENVTNISGASDPFSSIVVAEADFAGPVPPDSFYKNGKATCTSGPNSGVSREIADNAFSALDELMTVVLKREFPFLSDTDDTFTLTAGCDRTIESCIRYNNIINRRAEDYVPGLEGANRVPAAN